MTRPKSTRKPPFPLSTFYLLQLIDAEGQVTGVQGMGSVYNALTVLLLHCHSASAPRRLLRMLFFPSIDPMWLPTGCNSPRTVPVSQLLDSSQRNCLCIPPATKTLPYKVNMQGWRTHNLSGQFVPVLHHSHRKGFLPILNYEWVELSLFFFFPNTKWEPKCPSGVSCLLRKWSSQ